MTANLQLLTGGRFLFGIGAGWMEEEYRAYNFDFPRAAARVEQMEEAIQIVRLCGPKHLRLLPGVIIV